MQNNKVLLPIDYDDLRNRICSAHPMDNRFLLATLYVTGGRINEVLQLTAKSFEFTADFVLINLPTEKNKSHPLRIIPVSRKKELWITDLLEKGLKNSIHQENKLWAYSDRWVRCLVHRFIECHPHFLRHCRLTHLVKIWQFDSHRLMLYAGWSSPKPANVYVHLDWQDLAKKFD